MKKNQLILTDSIEMITHSIDDGLAISKKTDRI